VFVANLREQFSAISGFGQLRQCSSTNRAMPTAGPAIEANTIITKRAKSSVVMTRTHAREFTRTHPTTYSRRYPVEPCKSVKLHAFCRTGVAPRDHHEEPPNNFRHRLIGRRTGDELSDGTPARTRSSHALQPGEEGRRCCDVALIVVPASHPLASKLPAVPSGQPS
jgi:hypothetical protein